MSNLIHTICQTGNGDPPPKAPRRQVPTDTTKPPKK